MLPTGAVPRRRVTAAGNLPAAGSATGAGSGRSEGDSPHCLFHPSTGSGLTLTRWLECEPHLDRPMREIGTP